LGWSGGSYRYEVAVVIFFRSYFSVDRPDPTDERKELASNFGVFASFAGLPDPSVFFAHFVAMVHLPGTAHPRQPSTRSVLAR
jgi:hypothetical protein